MPARPPKVSTGGMFLIELDRHRFLSLIPPPAVLDRHAHCSRETDTAQIPSHQELVIPEVGRPAPTPVRLGCVAGSGGAGARPPP